MNRTLICFFLCSTGLAILAFSTRQAAAHCCHDDRGLLSQQQSEFRSGLHSLGDSSNSERRLGESPTVGQGLGQGRDDASPGGGLGQLRGESLGAYGAGSIGERGPGGLGAMKSGGLDAPPPRPR